MQRPPSCDQHHVSEVKGGMAILETSSELRGTSTFDCVPPSWPQMSVACRLLKET